MTTPVLGLAYPVCLRIEDSRAHRLAFSTMSNCCLYTAYSASGQGRE